MTKTELLATLATKFHIVLDEALQSTEGNINFYLVGVFDRDLALETVTRKNIGFFVEDEGQPAEAAFWNKAEPKPVPIVPPAFPTDVNDFIAAEMTAGRFIRGTATSFDLRNETAVGDVYLPRTPPEGVRGVFRRKPDRTIEFVETGKLTATAAVVRA